MLDTDNITTTTENNAAVEDWHLRFGGMLRLYGTRVGPILRAARVLVVGIGGVGSWTAESLARAGIGTIGLMDLDDICITNTNRQLPALDGNIGKPKNSATAERLRLINPHLKIQEINGFFGPTSTDILDPTQWDAVSDAIDAIDAKCLLLSTCHSRNIPVIACGGAGGKRDGTLVRTGDLAFAVCDPMLKQVRRKMRREYGFPRNECLPFGITSVFSKENPMYPWSNGTVCQKSEPKSSLRLDCNTGFGTATHVTGAFGLAAAGAILNRLLLAD